MTTKYTKDHEWVRIEGDVAIVGISTFAADQLGDVVYVELPAIGKAVKLYDCARNVVHAQDDRLMVLQGLEDFIVVSTKEALLVCRKQDEQQIKRFVQDLTAESGDRYV